MKERKHMLSEKFADYGKVKKWVERLLCICFMIVLMSDIYYSPIELLAEEKQYEVLSFSSLPKEVRIQTVRLGTPLEELTLPNTLTEVCRSYTVQNNESQQEEENIVPKDETEVISEVAIENITWISTPEYNSKKEGRYMFTPILPENYVPAEGVMLPEIFVVIETSEFGTVDKMDVATQEELKKALFIGVSEITLTGDISLTSTMHVPENANIVLDGQGFTLKRSVDENGRFSGTMLYVNGAENAEDTNGSLTLKNICVDGQIEGENNYAGSSAIIDYGNLILDQEAVIRGNCNYGTYNFLEDGGITAEINDYGGGIQVYGKLTLTEYALVTENFTREFGGGVYLAEGSTLYLYADVIRENTVDVNAGYGADLYAVSGSIIYYNTEIDMTREGFYLCDGVDLIEMDTTLYAQWSPMDNDTDNIPTDSGIIIKGLVDIEEEDGQYVAKITAAEDFKDSFSLTCNDNVGNLLPTKLITASDGGIIVEDNAPEIIFSSPDG